MPVVRVTKIGKARSGKHIVYFDNRHGQADGFLVSDKCNVPPEGANIDPDTKSWGYQGKTYWGLNDWKQVRPSDAVGAAARLPVLDAPAKALAGWDIQSGDLSRYASNIVASAITAGLIKEPQDIITWSSAAYRSGECLRHGFSSSMSQQQTMPDPNENQDRDPDDPGFTDDNIPF